MLFVITKLCSQNYCWFALSKQRRYNSLFTFHLHNCSCHLRLWKVNLAKTWVSCGELFDTLYWWASPLFESCLLFLFHALYLLSFLTPRYKMNHSSHSSQPHKEEKVVLPSANTCFFYCQQLHKHSGPSLKRTADQAIKKGYNVV